MKQVDGSSEVPSGFFPIFQTKVNQFSFTFQQKREFPFQKNRMNFISFFFHWNNFLNEKSNSMFIFWDSTKVFFSKTNQFINKWSQTIHQEWQQHYFILFNWIVDSWHLNSKSTSSIQKRRKWKLTIITVFIICQPPHHIHQNQSFHWDDFPIK